MMDPDPPTHNLTRRLGRTRRCFSLWVRPHRIPGFACTVGQRCWNARGAVQLRPVVRPFSIGQGTTRLGCEGVTLIELIRRSHHGKSKNLLTQLDIPDIVERIIAGSVVFGLYQLVQHFLRIKWKLYMTPLLDGCTDFLKSINHCRGKVCAIHLNVMVTLKKCLT